MKIVNGVLYLGISEAVEAEVGSEKYLWKAKSIGTKCYSFIDDPTDKRKALLSYDDLKQEHKAKVKARFGDPYDLVARQPILNMVEHDLAADDFFFKYDYELNSKRTGLTPAQKAQSLRSYAWLRFISKLNERRGWKEINAALGLKDIPSFFKHVQELIDLEKANGASETYTGPHQLPGNFPGHYVNLKKKVAGFTQAECPYTFCLPLNLGNKASAKLGKTETGYDADLYEKQAAIIRKVASLHMNMPPSQVNLHATSIFQKNGWPTITDGRVAQIMNDQMAILIPGRKGKRAYNNTVAVQIKRKRPSFPLSYFTLDGWTAELLYQDETGYDNRLVMVVVLDAMNNYPIGYAIGDRENAELIRQANRNALIHINQLCGEYLIPYQVQSDRFAIKANTPFFHAMAELFTPAAVGNAKSKVIEPYFNYFNETQCRRFPNWSGHNLNSSKDNQPNTEMLDLIKKSFPDKAGVIKQLELGIQNERKKKFDAYVAALHALPENRRYRMDFLGERWLTVFGQAIGDTNQLSGYGITKQINGHKYTYNALNADFRASITLDWRLLIDPCDMSKALAISPDGKQRYILDEVICVEMGIQDTTEAMRDHRLEVKAFNKARTEEIIQRYTEDSVIVGEVVRNTPLNLTDANESALKLMLTYSGQQKERLQDAKGLKSGQKKEQKRIATEQRQHDEAFAAARAQLLSSTTDFNQYLD